MSLSRRRFLMSSMAAPALISLPKVLHAKGPAAKALPATVRFTVGEATVTALLDGYLDAAPGLLSDFDEPAVTSALADAQQTLQPGGVRIPVNAFLIEQGARKTLIDAGSSNLMGDTLGAMGAALEAIGVSAMDIDAVALTHMHPDHAGGLLNTDGSAAFPNAQIAVSETEFNFWHDDAIMASVPESSRSFFQMARNSVAPYKAQLLFHTNEQEPWAGLVALPLPGHTPGHTGYLLQSGGEQLLFWGDIVHMTALQFANPGLTLAFDGDPKQTVDTRLQMFDRAVADNLLVTGAHLDFPGFGKVQKSANGFSYQAAPWQYGA
ncbi:MBL fold metallo-hydrolase [Shimia sp. R9_3]|uniref:MBL fold metallo-hydrolase n=1 Tax=Shimia sp. R9_3 TaxID=2821113 RepID=UPI001AD97091|nr:MBL fold metallo-hydrolase [Shimia sp. R9_3]MBO9401561.1 MBL fold metallo-hydrolase [Shimia sp. R9_3]